MAGIGDVVDILQGLRELVVRETALAAFVPAADAVLSQAKAIARGERDIQAFDAMGSVLIGRLVPSIPTRELAIALRGTFDRLPTIDGADEALTRAYAVLLRNAHVSILQAIFRQYPEILPSERTQ